MYLFAQPWCGACKRLKADFEANGEALVPISKEFIMVNIYGDDNKMFGVKSARRVFVLDYCSALQCALVCCTLQQPAPYPGRKPYLPRAHEYGLQPAGRVCAGRRLHPADHVCRQHRQAHARGQEPQRQPPVRPSPCFLKIYFMRGLS